MKPSRTDSFLIISELVNYIDSEKYFCNHVSFSPEEDGIDFHDDPGKYPPPFIEIRVHSSGDIIYFEIPEIVAYYAAKHPGYTYTGLEQREEEGARKLKIELKNLLEV